MKIDLPPRSIDITFRVPQEIALAWKVRCQLFDLDADLLAASVLMNFLTNQKSDCPGHGKIREVQQWKAGKRRIPLMPKRRAFQYVPEPVTPPPAEATAADPLVEEQSAAADG